MICQEASFSEGCPCFAPVIANQNHSPDGSCAVKMSQCVLLTASPEQKRPPALGSARVK